MLKQYSKKTTWLRIFNQSKPYFWMTLIVSLIASIAYLDFTVAERIAFGFLYLVPISLTAVHFRPRICFGVMFATVAIGFTISLTRNDYVWRWTPYFNWLLRVVAYAFLILVQTRLKTEAVYARTDYLTGLLNRRAFWEAVEVETDRCKRYHRPVSVAYVDVDDFKLVNDRYGHTTGDRFLKTFANTLKKSTRKTDFVARLGGDEFAVLMPETNDQGIQIVLKRLSQLAQVMNLHLFSITVSVGAVTYMTPPANAEALISAADNQMYVAKRKGKNVIESVVVR